jgi:hypothetical protein
VLRGGGGRRESRGAASDYHYIKIKLRRTIHDTRFAFAVRREADSFGAAFRH